MTAAQQQQAAKNFAAYWKGKGYEKGESQPFWLSLLRDVYGVEHPEQFIQFEEQVHLDHTSFIDGTIPATHVLIEAKRHWARILNKPIKQSDGALLTPFEQAKRVYSGTAGIAASALGGNVQFQYLLCVRYGAPPRRA